MDIAFIVTLVLNTLWLGAAFHYFSIRHVAAAKVLVPPSARDSPLFITVAASLRFLGGMNLALAVLSLALLFSLARFPDAAQRALLLGVFAIAHGSQFAFNVPIARGGGRQGEALWDVLRGPMRFIFIVDATLMALNAALCAAYWME
jgi:hypothetical protein